MCVHRLCFAREKFLTGNFSFARVAFLVSFFFCLSWEKHRVDGEKRLEIGTTATQRNAPRDLSSSLFLKPLYAGYSSYPAIRRAKCTRRLRLHRRKAGKVVYAMRSRCFTADLFYPEFSIRIHICKCAQTNNCQIITGYQKEKFYLFFIIVCAHIHAHIMLSDLYFTCISMNKRGINEISLYRYGLSLGELQLKEIIDPYRWIIAIICGTFNNINCFARRHLLK